MRAEKLMKKLIALAAAAIGVLAVRRRAGRERTEVWRNATDK
jgi:hypothetical protein